MDTCCPGMWREDEVAARFKVKVRLVKERARARKIGRKLGRDRWLTEPEILALFNVGPACSSSKNGKARQTGMRAARTSGSMLNKTRDRGEAERLLAKLQSEIFERHLRGGSSPDAEGFASAALRYMESGGERRYVAPLLVHFGDLPIDQLDQQTIDMAAAALYPNCGPERRVLNDGPLRKFGAIPDLAPISARPRPSHLRPMQPST